jgi:cell division control protein 24
MDLVDRMNSMGIGAPRGGQLSGAATFPATNSTTSLSSLSTATTIGAQPNGQVVATSNIINQRADASRSLYQICISLKQRLDKVPGFEGYMEDLEQMAADPDEGGPVESLWKLLRSGYPLLAIYNVLQPETPLQIQEGPAMSESKRSKIAILRFVEACKSKLMLPTSEVFIITDLAGNDTTGFVKVSTLSCTVIMVSKWSDKIFPLGYLGYQPRPRSRRVARPTSPNPTLPRRRRDATWLTNELPRLRRA